MSNCISTRTIKSVNDLLICVFIFNIPFRRKIPNRPIDCVIIEKPPHSKILTSKWKRSCISTFIMLRRNNQSSFTRQHWDDFKFVFTSISQLMALSSPKYASSIHNAQIQKKTMLNLLKIVFVKSINTNHHPIEVLPFLQPAHSLEFYPRQLYFDEDYACTKLVVYGSHLIQLLAHHQYINVQIFLYFHTQCVFC